jgi:hypothetical protein
MTYIFFSGCKSREAGQRLISNQLSSQPGSACNCASRYGGAVLLVPAPHESLNHANDRLAPRFIEIEKSGPQ